MKTAYAYLRVSGRGQVEGDGFVRQEQAIRQYAAANGYTIERVFREEGVSGTKDMESRPALLELLETVKETGGTVIIEKLDRLARDLMVSESILADFQRKGVTVVSVAEPDLCSSEPTRILMRQMMSAFAQYEKSMIVLKLRGARQRMKAKAGRCEGMKPFGYGEDERLTVGRIVELRATGMALDKIALALNAEGHRPKYGQRWHASSVSNVLKRGGCIVTAKAAKKAAKEPKLKRGKAMNLYLHEPDEARIRELGAFIYQERGKVSDSQVVKAALIAADADNRLLKAFDIVKSRDLRFKK